MLKRTAYKMAIDALEKQRRRHAYGYNVFMGGVDPPEFAKRDHKHYTRLTQAMEMLGEHVSKGDKDA